MVIEASRSRHKGNLSHIAIVTIISYTLPYEALSMFAYARLIIYLDVTKNARGLRTFKVPFIFSSGGLKNQSLCVTTDVSIIHSVKKYTKHMYIHI